MLLIDIIPEDLKSGKKSLETIVPQGIIRSDAERDIYSQGTPKDKTVEYPSELLSPSNYSERHGQANLKRMEENSRLLRKASGDRLLAFP